MFVCVFNGDLFTACLLASAPGLSECSHPCLCCTAFAPKLVCLLWWGLRWLRRGIREWFTLTGKRLGPWGAYSDETGVWAVPSQLSFMPPKSPGQSTETRSGWSWFPGMAFLIFAFRLLFCLFVCWFAHTLSLVWLEMKESFSFFVF